LQRQGRTGVTDPERTRGDELCHRSRRLLDDECRSELFESSIPTAGELSNVASWDLARRDQRAMT
jgi:hypothetical protein